MFLHPQATLLAPPGGHPLFLFDDGRPRLFAPPTPRPMPLGGARVFAGGAGRSLPGSPRRAPPGAHAAGADLAPRSPRYRPAPVLAPASAPVAAPVAGPDAGVSSTFFSAGEAAAASNGAVS